MGTFKIEASEIDDEALWHAVEAAGAEPLYGEEGEKGTQILYFHADESVKEAIVATLPQAEVSDWTLPAIDWDDQWRLHGHNYVDGSLSIDLDEFGYPGLEPVAMAPGAGFGDLSHPTTRLVMRMMGPVVEGRTVLDLGCGSGILALSAARLGAEKVLAVDIEDDALEHTKANASENDLDAVIHCYQPSDLPTAGDADVALLMNMITSEQAVAWDSIRSWHEQISDAVVSGVLAIEKDEYVKLLTDRHFDVVETLMEGDWIAFRCKKRQRRGS